MYYIYVQILYIQILTITHIKLGKRYTFTLQETKENLIYVLQELLVQIGTSHKVNRSNLFATNYMNLNKPPHKFKSNTVHINNKPE